VAALTLRGTEPKLAEPALKPQGNCLADELTDWLAD